MLRRYNVFTLSVAVGKIKYEPATIQHKTQHKREH